MKRQDTEDQVVDTSGESSAEGTSETPATPEGKESTKEQNPVLANPPAVNSEPDKACKRLCIK